jgi:hypothetical protein
MLRVFFFGILLDWDFARISGVVNNGYKHSKNTIRVQDGFRP